MRKYAHMHADRQTQTQTGKESFFSYLPGGDIFSEFLVDDATDGHQIGVAGHLG